MLITHCELESRIGDLCDFLTLIFKGMEGGSWVTFSSPASVRA